MTIEEDVAQLNFKLDRLRIEYEQYFVKIIKREPLQLRGEVDRLVFKNLNTAMTNTALKYKFQSLVAKYNSLKTYWKRTLRKIEDGSYHRIAEGGERVKVVAPPPPVVKAAAAQKPASPNPASGTGGSEQNVYDKYIAARKQCNEPTDGLSFDGFKKALDAQKKRISQGRGASKVDVKVTVKDGKAKITLVPKKKV